jgi:hypothetical protein
MLGVFKGCGSRMISKGIVVMATFVLLSACGGGGGNSTSSASKKLTANAGADLIVNTSARVDLDPQALVANVSSAKLSAQGLELLGSSDNKESIVALTWTKLEGPDFAISSSGFNDGRIYFIAPSTSGAASVKITFKLKITNAAGDSAEDTIIITVNRVNQAPVANAGADLTVDENTDVSLSAKLSADSDGSIAKYLWSQVAGQTVVLANPTSSDASFIAPAAGVDSTLEFELTVEDNEGKTAKDKVVVVVRQSNAPRVELYFPTKNAIYTESILSVFGGVSAKDATIAGVTVDLGAGPVPAVVNADGSWRLDKLAVPAGVAEFPVNVEAIDSLGRKSKVSSRLKTSTRNAVGEGQNWNNVVGISVDSEANRLWVMNSGVGSTPTRLFSIDLSNGNRSPSVSDFSNDAQGVSNTALTQMIFDAQTKSVFVSAAPASDSVLDQILRIDTLTGSRSLVSDKTRGTGPELKLPYGISAARSGELFVADNLSSNILSINMSTGDRKVVADVNTGEYIIDAPLYTAVDNKNTPERLFVMPNTNSSTRYILELDLTQTPAVSRLVTGGSVGSGALLFGTISGIVVDNKSNKLFAANDFGDLYAIDIATGVRTEIMDINGLSFNQIAFDEARGLIYAIDDSFSKTLYMIDPVTGLYAIVSKGNSF